MIWGHDYSMQLFVNLVILIIILSIHFIRRYLKRKRHQKEDEITKIKQIDKSEYGDEIIMSDNIILIGPIGVGKSTVAPEVARRTGKIHIDMDTLRGQIYALTDFSEELAEKAYDNGGIIGWHDYQKPFELFAVKTLLEQHRNSVIEFGGGQSVYTDANQADTFLRLVKDESFVILMLPCEDITRSTKILGARARNVEEKILNDIFISSETNKKAAKYVVYTDGKTPRETIDEIVGIYLNASSPI